jgi:biopolymer transport protein ExbD
MRTIIPRPRSSVGFNMTPAIDVVFQLIIFFLCTSHLARVESSQRVNLPDARSGQSEQDSVSRRIVTVLADETLLVGGSPIGERGIADMLRELKAAQPKGDIELRIRSDRAAPYRAIEPLLLECARNGIWKVSFAVLRESTRPSTPD